MPDEAKQPKDTRDAVDQVAAELGAQQQRESVRELWEKIGYHKPLAGYWYRLLLSLIQLILGILLSGVLVAIFFPYPESEGYRNVATAIFTLYFRVMDLGTNMVIDRYIAEYRIKNPKKMLAYVQFFIYYQMFTGIIQTTSISIYAIFIIPQTSLSYVVWIMLLHSTTQYPGFLGVFSNTLEALQNFDKKAILDFIAGEIFQRITELGFVFFGRWLGYHTPWMGEIMGIAIFAVLGKYIDDFFATLLAAHYFSKAMKREGIRVRDCFRVSFDWALVKEASWFGIKTGMPAIIGVGADYVMLWISIVFIPQYTTFIALSSLAGSVAGFVNTGASTPTPLIAESYLNGKKKLTQYYVAQSFRYAALFQFFFTPTLLSVMFLLPRFFAEFNLTNYTLAIPFLLPWIIRNLQQPYTSLADNIQLGTNHPNFLMIIRFLEEILKIVSWVILIVVLRLPMHYGIDALVWILPCGIYGAIMFKTISAYIYIHFRIIKLKVSIWQTIVAPVISGMIIFGLELALIFGVTDPLIDIIGFIPAILISLLIIIGLVIFCYMPLLAFFGGWDADSLRDFGYAARMSGPSKFLVIPMYKLTEKVANISPLHCRYPIDSTEAVKEARELLLIKKSHYD